MTDRTSRKILWWLCLAGAPAVLVAIELFHPQGFTNNPGMYAYLSKAQPHTAAHHALDYFGPEWWFALHMIQTPMVGLVALGLWLMVSETATETAGPVAILAAWVARIATFLFAVYYTVLDAIGGIGLGRMIHITERLAAAPSDRPHLTETQLDGVILVLNKSWTDYWSGGVGSVISLTGSWAIFVAAVAAAVALFLTRRAGLAPLALLVAFGWVLQVSHASYTGPIAFSLLFIAALWMRIAADRTR